MARPSSQCYSANERSFTRSSFNAIVSRKQFDAPRDTFKTNMLGLKAIGGETWHPNAILSRVKASHLRADGEKTLEKYEPKPDPLPTVDPTASLRSTRRDAWPKLRPDSAASTATSTLSEKRDYSSMMSHGRRSMSASQLSRGTTTASSFSSLCSRTLQVHETEPAYKGSGPCTQCWSPSETDKTRHSFNGIVRASNFDAPESMVRSTTMGKQAQLGAAYEPNPIAARRLNGTL